MSWNTRVIGQRDAVKEVIKQEQYIPQVVKDCITAFCDAKSPEKESDSPWYFDGIEVDTSGHYDPNNGQSNIYKLTIQPIRLAKPRI